MSKKYFEPTSEMNDLLTRAGSMNREESLGATRYMTGPSQLKPFAKVVGAIAACFPRPYFDEIHSKS